MSAPAFHDGNELLLELYRLSQELPINQFQDGALDLIRPAVPFDTAMWGSATLTDAGIDIHTIHLHRQSPEMLTAYEEVKHLDTAALAVGQNPSSTLAFNATTWFSGKNQQALRDYGKRFNQEHFFISGTINPANRFTRWLTLFRADDKAHCTETERQRLAALTPHVQQALEFNRRVHLQKCSSTHNAPNFGHAIADPKGVLQHMDPIFEAAVRREWDGWHGHKLPGVLLDGFRAGQPRFVGRTCVMTMHLEHHLLFLKTRPCSPADALTPRETTVAQLMASGKTHKEIAIMLRRAPSTVRNQIRSVYDKLNVSNVAGLIEQMRRTE